MATCKDCKDCFHYELCGVFDYISPDECGFYTDRSRFVELPSDGVMYGVLNGKPFKLPNYISPSKGKELFILSPETVNVPFFKSKEEAEQALKEREENA